jgi:hypothetical protein
LIFPTKFRKVSKGAPRYCHPVSDHCCTAADLQLITQQGAYFSARHATAAAQQQAAQLCV